MEYKKVKITPQIAEQWLRKHNVRVEDHGNSPLWTISGPR